MRTGRGPVAQRTGVGARLHRSAGRQSSSGFADPGHELRDAVIVGLRADARPQTRALPLEPAAPGSGLELVVFHRVDANFGPTPLQVEQLPRRSVEIQLAGLFGPFIEEHIADGAPRGARLIAILD